MSPSACHPHCPVWVTKGSRTPVPAAMQGRSLPAMECVLELGACVPQVESFLGDGVIRMELHQDGISGRVHFLRRLPGRKMGMKGWDGAAVFPAGGPQYLKIPHEAGRCVPAILALKKESQKESSLGSLVNIYNISIHIHTYMHIYKYNIYKISL